jgi:hypothetical protein
MQVKANREGRNQQDCPERGEARRITSGTRRRLGRGLDPQKTPTRLGARGGRFRRIKPAGRGVSLDFSELGLEERNIGGFRIRLRPAHGERRQDSHNSRAGQKRKDDPDHGRRI